MRRVSLPRLILIVLIFGVALVALGFQQIDFRVLGMHLERGTEAILGIRLGLDLQGGTHLVYQARGTNEISVTFEEAAPGPLEPRAARARSITGALATIGIADPGVDVTSNVAATLSLPAPSPDGEGDAESEGPVDTETVQQALAGEIGPIATFDSSVAGSGDTTVEVTFEAPIPTAQAPDRREQVRNALERLGNPDASIEIIDDTSMLITITHLSPGERNEEGEETRVAEKDAIREALAEIAPIAGYSVRKVPADASADQMEGVRDIIEGRVNPFGIAEPVIQLMDNNRVLVQLPGVHDVEEVKRLIGRTARLEFKERTCLRNTPITVAGVTRYPCELPENHVDKETGLTGEDLERAFPGTHQTKGTPIVNLQFNSRGTRIFAELTQRLFQSNQTNPSNPDRFVIFLDEEEIIDPVVRDQPILSGSAFIEGPGFTVDRVRTIAIQLESGRLPVPLGLVQELDIDATLGQTSLERSLVAGIAGLGLIMLFMLLYYKGAGVVATLALVIYTATVLAIFKLIPITLTLAGIAGFILSIGMAVDANVLIFERMKEELRLGRTLASAIEIGFSRAWPAIRDSNVSTMITSIILIWFGQRLGATLLAGFGTALVIGVAVSMFSSIFVSKTLLTLFGSTFLGHKRSWYTPESARAASGSRSVAGP